MLTWWVINFNIISNFFIYLLIIFLKYFKETINNLNTGKLIGKDKNKQAANTKSKQQQQQQTTSQQQALNNQTIVTPSSSMSLQHSASSTSVNRRNSNKNK